MTIAQITSPITQAKQIAGRSQPIPGAAGTAASSAQVALNVLISISGKQAGGPGAAATLSTFAGSHGNLMAASAGPMTQAQAVRGLQDNFGLLADPATGYISTDNLMDAANGNFHHPDASPAQKQQAGAAARYFLDHPYEYAALDTSLGRSTANPDIAVTDNRVSRGDLAATARGLAGEAPAAPAAGPGAPAEGKIPPMAGLQTAVPPMTQAAAIQGLQQNYALLVDPAKGDITTDTLMNAANGNFRTDAAPSQKNSARAAARYFLAHPYEYATLETAEGRSRGDAKTAITDNMVSFNDLTIAARGVAPDVHIPVPTVPAMPLPQAPGNTASDLAGYFDGMGTGPALSPLPAFPEGIRFDGPVAPAVGPTLPPFLQAMNFDDTVTSASGATGSAADPDIEKMLQGLDGQINAALREMGTL